MSQRDTLIQHSVVSLSPVQPPQLPLSASYAAGSMKGLMCAGPPDPNAVLVAARQYSPPQPAIAASL